MLIKDPNSDCFLCSPEPWRVIWSGQHVRIVAGLGPLCPGYVLLSPREHIHTAADLEGVVLYEFLAAAAVLQDVLCDQYGPGYTAYEHGKIGSCRFREIGQDFTSFCHHCHRVFIPQSTACMETIRTYFGSVRHLERPESVRQLAGMSYVYYETQNPGGTTVRTAFGEPSPDVQSQFMRRILASSLGNGRHYSWTADPRYEEMIDTISRLRTGFLGLDWECCNLGASGRLSLRHHVTIDGLSYVGKNTIAQRLAAAYDARIIDTGLMFRHMAAARSRGEQDPTAKALVDIVLAQDDPPGLRTPEIQAVCRELSANASNRATFQLLVKDALDQMPPSFVIGRDAWQIAGGDHPRFVVYADFDVRVRRRALWEARNLARVPDLQMIADGLRRDDASDMAKLPPAGTTGITWLSNGRRAVEATVKEATMEIEEVQ